MAKNWKAVEKAFAVAVDGHWIRDDKWDVEVDINGNRWIIEVKSEQMPRGLVGLWSILNNAWEQVTDNRERYGRPEYRRLVIYSPTGTGVDGSLAQWEENGVLRREPFCVWKQRHLQ